MEDIYATIANFGSNQLDSVIVNWEFNGVAQTSINYTTLIDTLNSSSGNTASLFLGTKMFTAGSLIQSKCGHQCQMVLLIHLILMIQFLL